MSLPPSPRPPSRFGGDLTRALRGQLTLNRSDETVHDHSDSSDVAIFTMYAEPNIRMRNRRAAGTPLQPSDLWSHNCLDFSFRRVQAGWPFKEHGHERLLAIGGNAVASNGDTLVQLAQQGLGIARVGTFAVAADIAAGRLVSLLDEFNPGDTEAIQALFVGRATVPARVRVFVDFLTERIRRGRP